MSWCVSIQSVIDTNLRLGKKLTLDDFLPPLKPIRMRAPQKIYPIPVKPPKIVSADPKNTHSDSKKIKAPSTKSAVVDDDASLKDNVS